MLFMRCTLFLRYTVPQLNKKGFVKVDPVFYKFNSFQEFQEFQISAKQPTSNQSKKQYELKYYYLTGLLLTTLRTVSNQFLATKQVLATLEAVRESLQHSPEDCHAVDVL